VFADICKEVRLDYLPEARVGDYVPVHRRLRTDAGRWTWGKGGIRSAAAVDELEENSICTGTVSAESCGI